jgi:integrase
MRLGEALSLRKKDFDFTKEPTMVSIQASFTKTREARETYISSEAKKLVLDLIRNKKDSDFVFADNFDSIMSVNLEETVFTDLRKRCGFTERYENSNRFVVNIHAFRAYFHTMASRINGTEYANALDGHTSYLGQYYRISPEDRAQMYEKLEPHLLIYGNGEQPGLLQDKLEGKNKEIDNLTRIIIEMKTDLEKIRKRQDRLEKTMPRVQ